MGGNVGNYTAALLAAYPEARVVTFEPSATNIDKLTRRFTGDARVTLVPCAVSDRVGEAQLWADTPGSGLGSLTKRDLSFRNLDFDASETVRTLRFEEYWRDALEAAPIDILKLDIEGHELDALRGAGAAIAHVRAVQFEFGGTNIDTRTYFKDFWDFFTPRGFALHRITPFGPLHIARYSEREESFTTTNYIAVAKGAA
ncbi:MAG: FkbM family methyltransferase [Rhodobacteraceae bacterium]|nr:MAG: FkbM family methyltransferase [Paracoccaceae bacterium]